MSQDQEVIPDGHFVAALQRVDAGQAAHVADEHLREVMRMIRRTGKKGTVSVTLEVGANGEHGYTVTAKVSSKAPTIDFGQSFFYGDKHGNLSRISPAFSAKDGPDGQFIGV